MKRGGRLPRYTPLQSGGALRRTTPLRAAGIKQAGTDRPAPLQSRPRNTGPDDGTTALVVQRDYGCCVKCSRSLGAGRGFDWSIQHRCARGAGGTRLAWKNMPGNLILLCGSGTTGCHGWVEGHPAEAIEAGWAVSQHTRSCRATCR